MSELERSALRSVFTKTAKAIDDLINKEGDLSTVLPKYNTLNELNNKLQTLNEEILQKIVGEQDIEEEDIEKEITKVTQYSERFHEVSEKIKKLQIKESDVSSNISNIDYHHNSKIRLPKIELKKFDGEIKNWIGFWAQFSKIHHDENLREEDKFEYLIQSMKLGSPAQKLIEGFPPSKENYAKAIELLRSRYGKDEFLIEYYVRELLTLVLKRSERSSVTDLYDQLEVQLRALDSLGVTKEKYAAMLFPLVESSIPESIFKVWERYRVVKNTSTREPGSCLTEFLEFLKIEVETEERLKLRENSLGSSDENKLPIKTRAKSKNHLDLPSAAVLVSSGNKPGPDICIFCNKTTHKSQDCFSLIDLSLDTRLSEIKKKGACLKCLRRGHLAAKCKAHIKCHICKGNHLAILCQKVCTKGETNNIKEPTVQSTNSLSAVGTKIKTTYLQTLTAYVEYNNKLKRVRVLCDSGSQRSFISNNCVKELSLKPKSSVVIQQEVFGGQKTKPRRHNNYNISIKSHNSDFSLNISVLEQPVICNQVPVVCNAALIEKLQENNIVLSDVFYNDDSVSVGKPIDLLLGADVWAQIMTSEHYKVNDQLVAIKTKLGWTVIGSSDEKSPFVSTMFVSMSSKLDLSKFWDLETMGIKDPSEKETRSERDKKVVEHFNATVQRDDFGRYKVKLPWVEQHPPLEENQKVAEKRLQSTTRKLNNENLYSGYDSVFNEWLKRGIIERVQPDVSSPKSVHYLPHRAVVKDGSTTRIRPVFDASNKDKNGYCINGCLETGPNLIELIPVVLTNFRRYTYGLSADIEKAFLQILVNEDDKDMLRFLWWEDKNIVTYRHTRLVFGLSCSPFLLGAVLNHLFDNVPEHLEHVANQLKKSFYVDNCLAGIDNIEDRDMFISQSQEILSLGGFNLRGWVGNGTGNSNLDLSNFVSNTNVENVLGLKWFCSDDELGINCNLFNLKFPSQEFTRRTLLSYIQKVFDPIGFTCPVSLIPKLVLQKTWSLKIGWDDNLPEELHKEIVKWTETISCLQECKIPRRIHVCGNSTLHVFCDASKLAFGACIFLRTEINGYVHIELMLAKSRVAPTKPMTLPRLELMGALTGVRLCSLALQCLNKSDLPVFYWTDSSVVLAWIFSKGKWSIFVENRVKEIRNSSDHSQWKHVSGVNNPADLLSRGCLPNQLLKTKWWEGPKWLYWNPDQWPTDSSLPNLEEVEMEKRRTVSTFNAVETSSIIDQLGKRISKYTMVVRTIAWIFRLKSKYKFGSDIDSEEFKLAEKTLFRLIQQESFRDVKAKVLSGLNTFVDEDGLIRLRSRVLNQEDSAEYLNPVILPSENIIVEKLIQQSHIHNKHAGTQALLVILRERIWILKGRKTIGRVIHKCLTCKKQTAKALEVPLPPLPEDRTNISSCFQVTGVDLAGPLYTKGGDKCWVVIFTCAVYRAVHLELTQSLSTDAFIQALRRFIARRGRVQIIYSDNGTNFTGLSNRLKGLDWQKIQNEFNLKPIVWKFNPPAAPWWGGFWERLIRILKGLLRRNLGNSCLSYEELNTLICECECIMNARPLTYVSEESDELKPLTPSLFLQSLQGNDVVDLDLLERKSLTKRWKYVLNLREGLRTRFRKEYLAFLKQSKRTKTDVVQEGDIVLVHSEGKKRISWLLGKIIQLFPGKDKIPRLAKIKTKDGIMLRPIQRLYPLEVKCQNENDVLRQPTNNSSDTSEKDINKDQDTSNEREQVNLRGRVIRKPKRLDL